MKINKILCSAFVVLIATNIYGIGTYTPPTPYAKTDTHMQLVPRQHGQYIHPTNEVMPAKKRIYRSFTDTITKVGNALLRPNGKINYTVQHVDDVSNLNHTRTLLTDTKNKKQALKALKNQDVSGKNVLGHIQKDAVQFKTAHKELNTYSQTIQQNITAQMQQTHMKVNNYIKTLESNKAALQKTLDKGAKGNTKKQIQAHIDAITKNITAAEKIAGQYTKMRNV